MGNFSLMVRFDRRAWPPCSSTGSYSYSLVRQLASRAGYGHVLQRSSCALQRSASVELAHASGCGHSIVPHRLSLQRTLHAHALEHVMSSHEFDASQSTSHRPAPQRIGPQDPGVRQRITQVALFEQSIMPQAALPSQTTVQSYPAGHVSAPQSVAGLHVI